MEIGQAPALTRGQLKALCDLVENDVRDILQSNSYCAVKLEALKKTLVNRMRSTKPQEVAKLEICATIIYNRMPEVLKKGAIYQGTENKYSRSKYKRASSIYVQHETQELKSKMEQLPQGDRKATITLDVINWDHVLPPINSPPTMVDAYSSFDSNTAKMPTTSTHAHEAPIPSLKASRCPPSPSSVSTTNDLRTSFRSFNLEAPIGRGVMPIQGGGKGKEGFNPSTLKESSRPFHAVYRGNGAVSGSRPGINVKQQPSPSAEAIPMGLHTPSLLAARMAPPAACTSKYDADKYVTATSRHKREREVHDQPEPSARSSRKSFMGAMAKKGRTCDSTMEDVDTSHKTYNALLSDLLERRRVTNESKMVWDKARQEEAAARAQWEAEYEKEKGLEEKVRLADNSHKRKSTAMTKAFKSYKSTAEKVKALVPEDEEGMDIDFSDYDEDGDK